VQLTGVIEADEVYIVTGHKGRLDIVAQEGRPGRRRRLKGKRGQGALADEKPLVLGLVQRDSEVVLRMLPNVQQVAIKPVITETVAPGSLIYTDEYDIYNRLSEWGMSIRASITPQASMLAMTMVMGFMKSMSTRWKASGHYCDLGCVRIVASRR